MTGRLPALHAHQIICDDLANPQHLSLFDARGALLEYWHAPQDTDIGKIGWARVERVFSGHGRVQLRLPDGILASARLPAKAKLQAGQMVQITLTAAAFADKPIQAVIGAELAGGHMVLRLHGAGVVRASHKSPKKTVAQDPAQNASDSALKDQLLAKLPAGVDLVLRRRAAADYGDDRDEKHQQHLMAECAALSEIAAQYMPALSAPAPAAPSWLYPGLPALALLQLYHPEAKVICKAEAELLPLIINAAEQAASQSESQAVTTASGAVLWIEMTHALVAIDVDSAASQKPVADMLTEICTEIMRQIRLRQLAGMIMVDLPRMGQKHKEQALSYLRVLAADDPRHPEIFGFGPLGVLEMRVRHGRTPMADLQALLAE